MYPNPQDVLPLPPSPSLEQYKKRAKNLVKACKSGESNAIRVWIERWLDALDATQPEANRPTRAEAIKQRVEQIEEFAKTKLARSACALADAQFVIARAHGFKSWPKFAQHLESLARDASPISAFETAADASVAGDVATLTRLLRENPELIRARSTREHQAMLLHYVAANGVENYRQRTPKNAVQVAEILLEAGAEVDAEADVYGGGATTLGLVTTSVHPFKAGVQNDLIDVLLKHGARLDHPGGAGNKHTLVTGCLANGRLEAAEYVASRGASLNLPGAAGVGRLDVVITYFNDDGSLRSSATQDDLANAFVWACGYGRAEVADFLLDRGIGVDARFPFHGRGHTGLHLAAYHAHPDIVRTLLRRGATVELTDETWGTTPLAWALYGWASNDAPMSAGERYYDVVAMLLAAGSAVNPKWLEWDEVQSDPRMRAALIGESRMT
jgi:ankyrin repeat protein